MSTDKLRKELITERGDSCEQCKRSVSKDEIKLEIHHIDGNRKNNDKQNLKLLCSLCHTYTDNYCNGNNRRKIRPSDEELYQALLTSESVAEALGKLNASDNSSSRSRAYQMIVERNITSYIEKEAAKLAEKEKRSSNNGKLHNCIECGKPINKENGLCIQCSAISRASGISNLSRDELKELIRTHPFEEIGRMYSISGNAVKKWCKKFHLPHRVCDISSFTDEEWEQESWNDEDIRKPVNRHFDHKSIANDYAQGMSTKELCDKYSCSADTVLKSCRIYGQRIRTSQEIAKENQSKSVINVTTGQIFKSIGDAMVWIWKERGYESPSQKQVRGGVTHIKDCCIGKSKSAYGYKWEYTK